MLSLAINIPRNRQEGYTNLGTREHLILVARIVINLVKTQKWQVSFFLSIFISWGFPVPKGKIEPQMSSLQSNFCHYGFDIIMKFTDNFFLWGFVATSVLELSLQLAQPYRYFYFCYFKLVERVNWRPLQENWSFMSNLW